jgi:hypothetical protein
MKGLGDSMKPEGGAVLKIVDDHDKGFDGFRVGEDLPV